MTYFFEVERQIWRRFPRVLKMDKRDENGTFLESRRYTPENECRLSGYEDIRIGTEGDWATVCECSVCGSSALVPPEYTRIAQSDELWPEYRYCPFCGAKVKERG